VYLILNINYRSHWDQRKTGSAETSIILILASSVVGSYSTTNTSNAEEKILQVDCNISIQSSSSVIHRILFTAASTNIEYTYREHDDLGAHGTASKGSDSPQ